MKRRLGFTLVELVFAMAVIAILMAVALPSYQSAVRKSRRAEVRALMSEAAHYMERYYAARDTYDQAVLPKRLTASPAGAQAGKKAYDISVTPSATSGYTITAVPVADDPCGTLTLLHTGERLRDGTQMSLEDCWR